MNSLLKYSLQAVFLIERRIDLGGGRVGASDRCRYHRTEQSPSDHIMEKVHSAPADGKKLYGGNACCRIVLKDEKQVVKLQ
jgi:hypothetical protein